MKTGDGDADDVMNSIIQHSIEIMKPVMESSVVLAAHYAKGCGRDCVTSQDMAYSMRYCAMHCVGKHIGSLFPEIYKESSDDEWETDSDQDGEDEGADEDEVEEAEFTRYDGDNELLNSINKSFDEWGNWEPVSPVEIMLKNAIEKSNSHI